MRKKGNRMNIKMVVALLTLVSMMVGGLKYMHEKRSVGKGERLLRLKGVTTLVAVIPALYAARNGGGGVAWLVIFAIVLCAAADVLLEIRFKVGMLAFGLGHVLFIAAFIADGELALVNWLAWAALSAWVFVYVKNLGRSSAEPLLPYFIYGVVIAAMLATALTRGPLSLVGAALFVLSDSILLWGLMRPGKKKLDGAIMLSYWGAQYLLSLSAMF